MLCAAITILSGCWKINKPGKITDKDYRNAATGVLLRKSAGRRPKRENREPAQAELNRRYRLERRTRYECIEQFFVYNSHKNGARLCVRSCGSFLRFVPARKYFVLNAPAPFFRIAATCNLLYNFIRDNPRARSSVG